MAICDDCIEDIERLKQIIKNRPTCPEEILFFEYQSGEELIEEASKEHDLIFLDIQMKGIDGTETAKRIRMVNKNAVLVFLSGIVAPTTESFKAQPYRYLMKYFKRSELDSELDEVLQEMIRRKKIPYFYAVSDGQAVKLKVEDILYISLMKRGSKIFITKEAKRQLDKEDRSEDRNEDIISNRKLENIYEELKDYGFEYAHNSYIVNFTNIVKATGKEITLEDNTILTISRSRMSSFHSRFSEFLGMKYRRGL
ncbi:LytR/AlgR family response regulator transcription factor [Anaeromicropila herbilytica]|uniref:LytR/AlgR family response regulator transcription factor n=1 Tax=Anaeromicropila herbilytica TaxID=2785025 RepID=UPI00232A3E4E|nr:LytTR family DNA-binding domain-containing protein [Anaeromicropila herbilytica]